MLSGHGGDGSVVGHGDLSVLSNFNDSTILIHQDANGTVAF